MVDLINGRRVVRPVCSPVIIVSMLPFGDFMLCAILFVLIIQNNMLAVYNSLFCVLKDCEIEALASKVRRISY